MSYTIQRKDGLAFVEEYNRNPAKYATDGGVFTSVKANQGRKAITADPYSLRTYLSDLWQTSPELINAVDVMNMTGYNENTVRRWMKEDASAPPGSTNTASPPPPGSSTSSPLATVQPSPANRQHISN